MLADALPFFDTYAVYMYIYKKQGERQTDRQIHKEREIERERQIDKQRKRERERERGSE